MPDLPFTSPRSADGVFDVLSFGAGVQSTTLLYMSCDGVLPLLDAAIFADTQWEPGAVYRHLETAKEKAARAGIRIITATAGNLRKDLIDFWGQRRSADGKRRASIPAFIKNPNGTRGIVRRQCTSTYKIEVVERVLREQILGLRPRAHWPKTLRVRQWIGISADEFERRRTSLRPAIFNRYPLLDEFDVLDGLFRRGFTRQDCLRWLEERGYPTPPRSACIGCPFHSDMEWADMKADRPEEFADACEVDQLIREGDKARLGDQGGLVGQPYLHSKLVPLPMVELNVSRRDIDARGLINECTGMCGN